MTIMLGQQSDFTKYPCFLCKWDSRAREKHYIKKDWPLRKNLEPGSKNILKSSLIPANKVLFPPLHIKLGLVKQFVKAMKTEDSDAFKYIYEKFLKLSKVKIKEGVFDGSQVRALLNDKVFEEKMTERKSCLAKFQRSDSQIFRKYKGSTIQKHC